MQQQTSQIETLTSKAARAEDSNDALKFSQAACNVANALCALQTAKDMANAASMAAVNVVKE